VNPVNGVIMALNGRDTGDRSCMRLQRGSVNGCEGLDGVGRFQSPTLHPGVDSCAVANKGEAAVWR
jgi:hypothetical protein